LVECVPNFSEGRRPEVIEAIVQAMARAGGVSILNQSSDPDHNRTVVTLVGLPDEVEKAMWAGIRTATELINLDEHQGVHPRFGASDVIPFIPIRDVSLDTCIQLAHRMGQRVANELQLPVYFYEAAAVRPHFDLLEAIRKPSFQYEQLREAISTDPAWIPDLGPAQLGPAGACIIGARMPLIAFNVYLNTANVEIAKKVAQAIRHSDGGLRYLKSAGFLVKGKAQVSMNLTNYLKTPLHRVVELIRLEAARYGASIESSELIGLIPEAALQQSAAWYLQLENLTAELILEERIRQAELQTQQSALPEGEPPIPEDATFHVMLPSTNEARRPEQFAIAVAQATATPGGGAVLCLSGALAAALTEMVAGLTIGRRGYQEVEERMVAIQSTAYRLREQLLTYLSEDIQAIDDLMEALRQARKQDDGDSALIQQATLQAADVPLKAAHAIWEVLQLLEQVTTQGNHNAVIDAAVGANMALAALESAALNMQVNLLGITDDDLTARYRDDMKVILQAARPVHRQLIEAASQRVGLAELL
jgi:glutamate formiminotransferase/formiminotetrahydrofolate cyclodeaminase